MLPSAMATSTFVEMTLNNLGENVKRPERELFSEPSVEIIRFEDGVSFNMSDTPGENEGWSDDIR